jgi:hypothetical protein
MVFPFTPASVLLSLWSMMRAAGKEVQCIRNRTAQQRYVALHDQSEESDSEPDAAGPECCTPADHRQAAPDLNPTPYNKQRLTARRPLDDSWASIGRACILSRMYFDRTDR